LPTLLRHTKGRHERVVDELPIEIVLGLVDDKGRCAVRTEHECKQYGLLLAERELREIARCWFGRGSLANEFRNDETREVIKKAAFQGEETGGRFQARQEVASICGRKDCRAGGIAELSDRGRVAPTNRV